MAQSFISMINSALKADEDIEDDDFFELEWNQFSTAIWNFSSHVLATKSDEERSQIKNHLTNLKNLKDQIQYVFEDSTVNKEAETCASVLISDASFSSKKDLKAAHEFAKNAEIHAASCELDKAISGYNKAISLLDFTSDAHDLQLFLRKRAKVLFDSCEFEASLIDVEDVIEFANTSSITQSTDLQNELLLLKEICLQKIHERGNDVNKNNMNVDSLQTTETNFLKIPFLNENELLPGASSKVEMAYSEERGRIIRAKTDICKGETLFSEPFFACWLRPSKYKRYCFYCVKKLKSRYFPCRQCNNVRYCSLKCERKAWSAHHKIDCDFLPELQKMSYAYLATKILITQGIHEALLIEKEDFTDLSHFPTQVFAHNYRSFSSLVTYSEKVIFEHLFAFYCGIVILVLVLEKMKLIDREDENYFDISATILKLIYRINLNCYLIRDHKFRQLDTAGITLHTIQGPKLGIAIYLSSSLISHSCDYNSLRVSNAASMLLVAERDIKGGEEVTVTYCPHYKKMSFKDRQKFLSENYYFECRCCACVKGWENILEAMKCKSCNGPLIWSEDHSNYCVRCGEESDSIEENIQIIQDTNELHTVCARLITAKEYEEAILKLCALESLLDSVYFSNIKQMKAKERLSLCFEHKGKFKAAFKCLKGTIEMRMSACGGESLEVVYTLIQCIYLLKNSIKTSLDPLNIKERKQIKQFRRKAIEIMKTYQHSNILLLDSTYTNSVEYFSKAFKKYTSRYGLSFNFLKL